MKSTISIDAAPTISNLFIHEQIRSERFANIARIFFAFVYIAIGFVIKNEVPQSNFDFLMMGAFANLAYALFVCILSLRKKHYRWLKYLSTTLDIAILSGLLTCKTIWETECLPGKLPDFRLLFYSTLSGSLFRPYAFLPD